MKVCTDACILGAWFAPKVPDVATILDIGSGTGLLMMMLAQKSKAEIHGIEIDPAAFNQLRQNTDHPKWRQRLKVFFGDARQFSFPVKYDFIIANPPFYENDLKSISDSVNTARHSTEMTLEELLFTIKNNLLPHGAFGILLPIHRAAAFVNASRDHRFFLTEKLEVRQTSKHPPFRSVLHFSRNEEPFIPEFELIIQRENGLYTREFTELMRAYYLQM